jgi:predicted dehydrogenase
MVGYNRRFAPLVVEAKRHLDPIREPKAVVITVNAGMLPSDHWHHDRREGGGRLLAEGCHFIDLLRHVVGHPPERVEAVQMGAAGGRLNDDQIAVTIRFQDGSLGTLHYLGNGPASFPKERIEVFVAGRALQIDNFRVLRAYGWPGVRTIRHWRQDKGHGAEMKAFVRAVEAGGPSPIRYEELIEGMRLCFQAQETAAERGSP